MPRDDTLLPWENKGLQVTVIFWACRAMLVNKLMYRIVTSVIAFGYVSYSVRQTGSYQLEAISYNNLF
jgi:hypothetical protein